jgi:hypothetical protein
MMAEENLDAADRFKYQAPFMTHRRANFEL